MVNAQKLPITNAYYVPIHCIHRLGYTLPMPLLNILPTRGHSTNKH